jgi:hypothetical protein
LSLGTLGWIVAAPPAAAAPIRTLPEPILQVEIHFGAGTDFTNLFELRFDATFSGFDAGETMQLAARAESGGLGVSLDLKRLVGGLFVDADPLPGPVTTQRFALFGDDLDSIQLFDETILSFFFDAALPGEAELVSLAVSGVRFGGAAVTVEATTSLDAAVALPEPGTLLLLGAGALAMLAHARHRRAGASRPKQLETIFRSARADPW